MNNGQNPTRKYVAWTVWPFVLMACLLAVTWWSMSLNLFSDIRFPVAPHMQKDAEIIHQSSLGVRVGFWIASKGWDSGPPTEYAYDFILFWHFSISALLYFFVFATRRRSRDIPELMWMLTYPIVCIGIFWMLQGVDAHHVISVFLYAPCLSLMTLIVLELKCRHPGRIGAGWLFLALAALSFSSPIHGKGWDVNLFLVIILALLAYSAFTYGRLISTMKTMLMQHG